MLDLKLSCSIAENTLLLLEDKQTAVYSLRGEGDVLILLGFV